jgi:hypothetical protein
MEKGKGERNELFIQTETSTEGRVLWIEGQSVFGLADK